MSDVRCLTGVSPYVCVPAYKEKMKELSVLSLICSCFYPEARNKFAHEFEGISLIFLAVTQTLNTLRSEIKCLSGHLLSCSSNILSDSRHGGQNYKEACIRSGV